MAGSVTYTLDLPPGLNSDDTTFAAQGRWADGLNVRFHNGKPEVRGGVGALFTLSPDTYGFCRAMLPFRRAGGLSIAYGLCCQTNGVGPCSLQLGAAAVPDIYSGPIDITPAGATSGVLNWSLAPWGETLLACPEGGTLYEQSGAGIATEVTEAPDEITYMLVTPERQVVALGCNEEVSGDFNGLCIRGCDFEDYTTWTTSSDNNAFEHILDGAGKIVAGRMVGSYLVVWTDEALYVGQFVGNPEQTYRFDRVADDCGLAGPNAVIVSPEGAAYWVSPQRQFHLWRPGGAAEVLPCSIGAEFRSYARLSTLRTMAASYNSKFREVRFDHESNAPGEIGPSNGFFVAVSLADGSWHRGSRGMTAMADSGAVSSALAFIGGSALLGVDGHGNYWEMELTTNTLDPTYIQTADLAFQSGRRRIMIKRVIPDFENQTGDVSMTIYTKDRPQDTPVEHGPFTLSPGARKKDFRVSGMIFAVRFEVAAGGWFRLGAPVFDCVPMGER